MNTDTHSDSSSASVADKVLAESPHDTQNITTRQAAVIGMRGGVVQSVRVINDANGFGVDRAEIRAKQDRIIEIATERGMPFATTLANLAGIPAKHQLVSKHLRQNLILNKANTNTATN